MKCLITGMSGFIGTHLSKTLKDHGLEPIAYPRPFYESPVHNQADINSFFNIHSFDHIVHLAASGNLAKPQKDDDAEMKTNVLNFYNFLKTIGDMDYIAFINFSSSSVTLPVQTLYSSTKKCAEALLESYPRPSITVRPYSVTGVGEQSIHLIPTLIDAAYTGKTVPFVGWPKHDFIDVEDVCCAVLKIFELHAVFKGLVVPLGTGVSYSNEDVKYLVEKLTGRDIDVKKTSPMRSYDTTEWKADSSLLTQFGWRPRFSLEQTITKMIHAYKKSSENKFSRKSAKKAS